MSRGLKRARRTVVLGVLVALLALPACSSSSSAPETASHADVSISGTKFLVNGEVTYPGSRAEGLLLNSRMVQAIFDDENPATRSLWAYPDTGAWDPERNTDEFVAALPSYAAKGLKAVTVNLQGGRPVRKSHPLAFEQPWEVSAYRADGSLKTAWTSRLARVLRATDENGIVVILGLFYGGQDQRLAGERDVLRATDEVTDWLLRGHYRNVLVEVDNECNLAVYDHAILRCDRVAELVRRVQSRSHGALLVSASLSGGHLPPDSLLRAADFVLLHGNNQTPAQVAAMVSSTRSRAAYQAEPKPIVFNEDSTSLENMDAAVAAGASWGYYDKGDNNYRDGFQAPPVDWRINTAGKRAFFERVASLAAGG